jgi:hypothetical protein
MTESATKTVLLGKVFERHAPMSMQVVAKRSNENKWKGILLNPKTSNKTIQ